MVEGRWTLEKIEEFDRRYEEYRARKRREQEEKRRNSPWVRDIPVKIVELNLDFNSINACAGFLKVDPKTVRMMVESGKKHGDLTIVKNLE